MPARFHEVEVSAKLKDKRKLSAFLDELVKKHNKKFKKAQLTYIFCNDAYLLQINKDFLKHNTFTDIITFDLSEDDGNLTGEIYVSIERVLDNAHKYAVPYTDELLRVIFHGALHLCGFKDKKDEDKQEMRKQEDAAIRNYKKTLS